MKKIVIICFYFGKWPRDFSIFLNTCIRNSTIDFLIFTDCIIPDEKYPNVKFVKMSLGDISKLLSEKLDLEIKVTKGYKLCDYRPAFGVIFSDYIKGYEFWGYSDIDIIFGNIRNFLTDEFLSKYDIISVRKEFLSGFFTIYRNEKLFTEIYKRGRDNKRIFLDTQKNYVLEECGYGLHWQLFAGKSLDMLPPYIDSMTHILKRSKDVRTHFETLNSEQKNYEFILVRYLLWRKKNWRIDYDNGILFDHSKNKEIIFFHSVIYKHSPSFYIPIWDKFPSKFKITDKGIFNLENNSLHFKLLHQFRRCIYYINFLIRIYTKKGSINKWAYLQCFFIKKWIQIKKLFNIN